MSDEIKNSEKKSKSIMRSSKAVKYSRNLMFVAGAMGVTTGVLLSNTVKAEPDKKNKDENLKNTVDETQAMLKNMRNRNKMYIRGANLELIQLMEQGDQVVKSPWSSWQFGMNFFSNADIISGDGYGDKEERYTYNGLYFRNNWKMKNALATLDSMGVMGLPITPGSDSQVSWRNATGNIYSEMNFDKSKGSSVNGEVRWGLVELRKIQEPLNEVEILARISPKEVKKEAVSLSVAEPTVEPVGAPVVDPKVNTPLTAPVITIPEVSVNVTPVQPNVSVKISSPKINTLNIIPPDQVGNIKVTSTEVKPVEFILGTGGLSDSNRFQAGTPQTNYNLNNKTINVVAKNYISTWGRVTGLGAINTTVNVKKEDTRAFMVDEGIDYRTPNVPSFNYNGILTLEESKNVGIDVQGTHTSLSEGTGRGVNTVLTIASTQIDFKKIENVANIQVINSGKIIGKGNGDTVKNQVAFGFNNFDTSSNNTRTQMINKGTLVLNAPESAGIQLRPEFPTADHNTSNNRGLNMMTGENENTGNIIVNSRGSFGLLTVRNASGTGGRKYEFNVNGVKTEVNVSKEGKIASRGQVENMSKIENLGTITISGDSSVGVGLMHSIQAAIVDGTINIGNKNPSTLSTDADYTGHPEYQVGTAVTNNANEVIGGHTISYMPGLVEKSVGVYAKVKTTPVKNGERDDHGLLNNNGNIVGTESVEVSGKINLGDYSKNSSGLVVQDEGSITLMKKGTSIGTVNVGGEENYGAVAGGISSINIEEDALIDVTGKQSIGYVLLSGNGYNKGNIKVVGNVTNAVSVPDTSPGAPAGSNKFGGSVGFFGEKGKFENNSVIEASGNVAYGVVLKGDLTDGTTFTNNNGTIKVSDNKNIGVYANGKYIFEHKGNNGLIKADEGTIGIYATDVTATSKLGNLKINAPIELSDTVTIGKTTIGIVSDGNADVNFGTGSKLTIGKAGVGLFSVASENFSNTFKINNGEQLEVSLKENSTLGLLKGNNVSPSLKTFLKDNNGNNKLNITNSTNFGSGATLFYATNSGTSILDTDYTATYGENSSTSILSGKDNSTVGIKSGATLTTNTKVSLIATETSTANNEGNIISTRTSTQDASGNYDNGVGIYTNKSTGKNSGIITMNTIQSVGIFSENNSSAENTGKIETIEEKSAGIYAKDSNVTQSGTGTNGIYADKESSAGIFSEITLNTAVTPNVTIADAAKTVTNTGYIKISGENSAGIFGKLNANTDKKLLINNSGEIEVVNKNSAGIFADNLLTTSPVDKLVINNTGGTINLKNIKSVGIYAPKSTVSGVGKITLDNAANESIGVYAAAGSAITTTTAEIDLGKGTDQNRVAYYVKNENTALTGDNIGKISGYGVGVYLEGTSATDVAKLITPPTTPSTPALDYTTGNDQGNGIIGLYLRGNTNISGYGNQIKVGDSVNAGTTNVKYAIGIYADRQGTAANKYQIQAPITTGANGIGIFVGKDDASNTGSSIKYSGTMSIGDGTTSGTGIYIADKPGTGDNEATLGSTSHIKLNGTNGVGVIIGKGSKLSIDSGAKIELLGNAADIKGVGIYGLKGSQITGLNGLNFQNHGKTAEMVRTVEGQANIANTNANPGIVVTHVINGETSLAATATISTPANSYNNIGLMAQGTKNPNMTWAKGDYEIVNDGTIDFSGSKTSTGIYAESARAQLRALGKIMLGEKSTGIYGVYNSNSPKYEGAPLTPNPNKLTVETLAGSEIELGKGSVGVYLKNASTGINLDGKIKSSAGATKNVGIYMINEAGTQHDQGQVLTGMVNGSNSEITLGDGSVGLYSRGKGSDTADRNTVTNKGKITVGKKIAGTPSVPSVGIYSENTNLITDTTSNITVGEDGIAFYGKHSDITAKGTVNFNNKGVLAYLENSNFVSHLGNISPTQNTMLYLKNSTAQMDGAGVPVDMTVADGYTGAYVEGNSRLTGVRKITLGRNSNGIFLQNANFDSTGITEIVGTQQNAKGILGINSSLLNKTKISLSGDNSIGIYSNADSTKSVVNEGKLELSGKKTLGVFLKGSQSFENKADISIADSVDAQNPTIGVYTSETSPITLTSGNIEVGVKSIGVYSTKNSPVTMTGGNLHVKDEGMGIYKQDGSVSVAGNIVVDPHTATTPNTEPVGVYAVNGASVNDSANVTVGEKSYGFILNNDDPSKVNTYTNTAGTSVTLGSDSTYLYSGGKAQITNNKDIAAGNVDRVIGFYVKGNNTGGGNFVNNGLLDFSNGKGNIAVYAPGSTATNSASGRIYVGATDYTDPLTGQIYSDKSKIVYGIGMATDNGGQIANDGEIRIFGDKSIGMYGSGAGTVVENRGNILLDGSRATASNKIESMTGVYVDEGAKFVNKGIIKTTDSYAGRGGMVNPNVSGLVGVAVMNGSTLINEAGAKILIDADNSYGVVIRGKKNPDGTVQRYATIKNYGEIKVRGKGTYGISWKDITPAELADLEAQINSRITSDPNGQEVRGASGTDKEFEGVKISIKNGQPVFTKDGVPVSDAEVAEISKLIGNESNLGLSDIGFYVDTLGRTRPIDIDGSTPPINSQLIIGTEYSEMTNSKYWVVKGDVIKPFLDQVTGRNFKLTSLAGSLTWMATPILDSYGEITGVAMAKVPYTSFVRKTENAWNFTDGLEQRYGVNSLDSREKLLFNKLNSIGNNEPVLLTQAFDEMMGHQYANIQQRVHGTGRLIDKEITHLAKEWETKSKQSNKIKVFGMKDEYTTDTAGIIDYTSDAYGFAYLHEDETVKLGNVSGWYAGGVHNKFKFKDIGGSRENQTMLKLGIFKTMTPASDHNGNLQWTISGEGYVSKNEMHRKYLVVDEIFNAKSDYTTYGVAVKNEVGYNIRTSERTSIRPYGSLKVEYGRFSNIKEKSGEMRLDVEGNGYYSIKPAIGVEFNYRQPFAVKSIFTASLGLGYESELGKVGNVNNRARVSYTSADWFNIRGEKDNRKGKLRADLNFGIENSRVGMTLNTGYDSDNNNLRGGLGFRLIY